MIAQFKEARRILAVVFMTVYSVIFLNLFYTAYLNPGRQLTIYTDSVGEGTFEAVMLALSVPLIIAFFLEDLSGFAKCVACRLKYKNDS